MTEAEVLKVVEENPGFSGYRIHQVLVANSRIARWFGRDSTIACLFGPGVSSMYVHLNRMEDRGVVTSNWGIATPERGGHRPRNYYACRTPAPLPQDGQT